MLNMTNTSSVLGRESLREDVLAACNRIPPLWDLPNYVAVNPFLGFADEPIGTAARTVAEGLGARVLPGYDFYQSRWASGAFGPADLEQAALRSGVDPATLRAVLAGDDDPAAWRPSQPVLAFAERYDQAHQSDWHAQLLTSSARWCAAYATGDDGRWGNALRAEGLYRSWRQAAIADRSLELLGLHGWRNWVRETPADPMDAIDEMLARTGVRPEDRVAYLYRLLGGVYGWASYFRRYDWQAGSGNPIDLIDLLAIRICGDAAVPTLLGFGYSGNSSSGADIPVPDEAIQLALQEALEDGYTRGVLSVLNAPPAPTSVRPAVQAVFCIDVRSEPFRRHLEAQSDGVETRGFAGFFGVSLDWRIEGQASARCPVLLRPAVTLKPTDPPRPAELAGATTFVQAAPAAAFNFVELLGITYGLKLVKDTLSAAAVPDDLDAKAAFDLGPSGGGGVTLASRIELAAGILKNMGFSSSFARVVMLCGHTGHSANNPHAAGLDCGACGGHGGAINARVAAALLNDPRVREGLTVRGFEVPTDTHFLPAVHDTTTDVVTLLDLEGLPSALADDVQRLQAWLQVAGDGVRNERAAGLGLQGTGSSAPATSRLLRLLGRRSRDWSEVRPEWALARNAAFIAARRQRTRGVDLGGRSFLHEYDAALDPDGSVLTLILSAPMVVASWINLQYFASTVDNDVLGAGNKALHNRVGTVGVVLGNGGDLRTGLPQQSVHAADGSWYHEPLRLQVIVEAPLAKIEHVLTAQKSVRDLVDNGWVRLFAIDPDHDRAHRWVPGVGWEPMTGTASRGD